jgi:hypothetical protein
MSQVTRAAGVNLSTLLGAVGSAARTLTTTFDAMNSAADTLATHTEAWAMRSKVSVQNETLNYLTTATQRSKIDLAKQLAELDVELTDPAVKAKFTVVEDLYKQKLDR